jgi:hypothetical protein
MGNNQNTNKTNDTEKNLFFELQKKILLNQMELQKQIEELKNNNNNVNNINSDLINNYRNTSSIFTNPYLQSEIINNPTLKAKFLNNLLKTYRNQLNNKQIETINKILNELPGASNAIEYSPPATKIYSNDNNLIHNDNNLIHNNNNNNMRLERDRLERDRLERDKLERDRLERDRLEKNRLERDKLERDRLEKERYKREEYRLQINNVEEEINDALKLFQLNKNFTLTELKLSFKKLSLIYHEDRIGGSKEQFQKITKYYLKLQELLKNSQNDKQFDELRGNYKKFINSETDNKFIEKIGKDNFDIKQFNKVFEDNKLYDPNEEGYSDWLKNEDNIQELPDISKLGLASKFDNNKFNREFNKYAVGNSQEITEYNEPQALASYDRMGFVELGGINNNFTKTSVIGASGRDLTYCDLKSAYTNNNTLINPNNVKARKEYKNIDELKRERSNISYELTPEEAQLQAKIAYEEKMREELRLRNLENRDQLSAEQYKKIHKAMLGYSKEPDLSR